VRGGRSARLRRLGFPGAARAPRSRQFAIVGDSGVHEKCGDAFWQDVSAQLGAALRQGDYTAALIQTVRQVGDLLAAHFPPVPGDGNELPDAIIH